MIEKHKSKQTPEEKELEMLENIQKVFDGFQEGYLLSVKRVEPKWCEGTLETIELTGDTIEEINTDEIVKKWGGEVLRLVLLDNKRRYLNSATLKCRSFEPRLNFRKLLAPWEREEKKEVSSSVSPEPTPPPFDMSALMEALRGIIADERAHYATLTQQIQTFQPPSPPPPPQFGIGEYVRMARQMKELQKLMNTEKLTSETLGESESDTMALIKTIGDVISAIKPSVAVPPQYSRIANSPPNPQTRQLGNNLPAMISKLDPNDFASLALTSLSNMERSKAEIAIQKIVTGLGLFEERGDEQEDEQEENEVDDDSENFDTETESDMD